MIISDYIKGGIVLTLVMMAGVTILSTYATKDPTLLSDAYSAGRFTSFNSTFNKMAEVTTATDNIKTASQQDPNAGGVLGWASAILGSVWNFLSGIFTTLDFMSTLITGLTAYFGIPAWATALIGMLIVVGIGFAIWSASLYREL